MTNQIDTNKYCDGCSEHCEYGYFLRGRNGAIYPTLNGRVIEAYWTSRSNRHFIQACEIKDAQHAIVLAKKIAQMCNHHKDKQY